MDSKARCNLVPRPCTGPCSLHITDTKTPTSPGCAMPAPQDTASLLQPAQGEAGAALLHGSAADALLLSLRLRCNAADGKSLRPAAGKVSVPCVEAGLWRPLECS